MRVTSIINISSSSRVTARHTRRWWQKEISLSRVVATSVGKWRGPPYRLDVPSTLSCRLISVAVKYKVKTTIRFPKDCPLHNSVSLQYLCWLTVTKLTFARQLLQRTSEPNLTKVQSLLLRRRQMDRRMSPPSVVLYLLYLYIFIYIYYINLYLYILR